MPCPLDTFHLSFPLFPSVLTLILLISVLQHPHTMPAVERLSLPQSLSAVAVKSRRLFSRDNASSDTRSRSTSRSSALNLNEALELASVPSSSPLCLSNQLLSPQPSISSQSHSWGLDNSFGRRRCSNATTASTSSVAPAAHDGLQRRRKSLFLKKPRSEALADDARQESAEAYQSVDPLTVTTLLQAPHQLDQHRGASANQSGHRLSTHQHKQHKKLQQQQHRKKEALDRISDLVCLSVQNQTQLPQSQVGASSPRSPSTSPNLGDRTFFYPIESPPSPTSLNSSSDASARRASIVAFPSRIDATAGLRVNMGGDANWSSLASPSLSTFSNHTDLLARELSCDAMRQSQDTFCAEASEAHQLLLPSSMKRQSSRTIESDANKKSFASLKAELGHGAARLGSRTPSDWSLSEDARPALQPLPPLRPLRNPMRSRSKSLSSSTVRKDLKHSPTRSASPPPPVPALPPSRLVEPYNLTPVHTPPRSRPTSAHRGHARCDSLTSAASSASLQAAAFHTPTFGPASWTNSPVS